MRLQKPQKNQGNTIPPKKHSKLAIPDHKAMEIHELPNKEFKTIGLEMLRELQEIRDKEFNKIKKAIQEQNEKFNKDRKYRKETNKFWR